MAAAIAMTATAEESTLGGTRGIVNLEIVNLEGASSWAWSTIRGSMGAYPRALGAGDVPALLAGCTVPA